MPFTLGAVTIHYFVWKLSSAMYKFSFIYLSIHTECTNIVLAVKTRHDISLGIMY